MKKISIFVATISILVSGAVHAQELGADAISSAPIASIAPTRPAETLPIPDPAIIHLQVLLDRAGASPGVIDGFYGENVTKAVAGFEAMQGLPVDGKLDPQVIQRLTDDQPVVQSYVVVADDAKDLVDSIPTDYAKQAAMKNLGYTSVAERLAERFHMDIDLLKSLNPGATFTVGSTVLVTMPGGGREGKIVRIEARRKEGQLLAFAADGSVLAVYPATIGSKEMPSPSGKHKVKGVARMPVYVYNPKINFQQGKNRHKLTLPSGPNGPVGTVWIDLTEPTYGIHGTPEPSLIDKAGSHGCVRLTNWDVEELANMVKPGVVVDFVDHPHR